MIDASHHDWQEQAAVVDAVLNDLELDGRPVLHVFNKIDLVQGVDESRTSTMKDYEEAVFTSATERRTDELRSRLAALTGTVWRSS